MSRKSRLVLIIAAASLPLVTACSDAVTGPGELRIRRDGVDPTVVDARCGDSIPWGIAPCPAKN